MIKYTADVEIIKLNHFPTFEAYLTNKAMVSDKYRPWYLKWVSDCKIFLGLPPNAPINSADRQRFLDSLANKVAAWQIKQADSAIRLYGYFLAREKNADMVNNTPDHDAWTVFEGETRRILRLGQKAYSTEKTYIGWLRNFGGWLNYPVPQNLTPADIKSFLGYLATERKVAAATQNQALNALVFVYRVVLLKKIGVGELDAVRTRRGRRLPTVLSREEINKIFHYLDGTHELMARLIYGCGLRLVEGLSLRIKDIDLEQNQIIVRAGKGNKDRRTMLPES